MEVMNITCVMCGRVFESLEIPRRGKVCFKCHVNNINLGFTYGKKDFHGDTVKQRQERQVSEAAAAGRKIEPVGTRWV